MRRPDLLEHLLITPLAERAHNLSDRGHYTILVTSTSTPYIHKYREDDMRPKLHEPLGRGSPDTGRRTLQPQQDRA